MYFDGTLGCTRQGVFGIILKTLDQMGSVCCVMDFNDLIELVMVDFGYC